MNFSVKVSCLSILILMSFLVSGCQLAKTKDEQNTESEQAQLVGAYITYLEDIDLDIDDVINDSKIESEKKDKVYAKCVEVEIDGTKSHQYIFEDYEGMSYFAAYVPEKISGTSGYYTTMCTEGVLSIGEEFATTDTGTDLLMQAEVYFIDNTCVYVNPVYQEKDGDIYFVPAQEGNYISGSGGITVTLKEEGASSNTSVDIDFAVRGESVQTKVTQIGNDKVLKCQTYMPGEMPEKLELEEGAECVLVNTSYSDEEEAFLEIYTSNDSLMMTISERTNNVLAYETTELIWQD